MHKFGTVTFRIPCVVFDDMPEIRAGQGKLNNTDTGKSLTPWLGNQRRDP